VIFKNQPIDELMRHLLSTAAALTFVAALLTGVPISPSSTSASQGSTLQGSESVAPGTATLTLENQSGTQTAEMSAHFSTGYDSLRSDSAFVLYLYDGSFSESSQWAWVARTAERPTNGSYSFSPLMRGGPLAEETFKLGGELGTTDDGRVNMLVSQDGSLTITSSTAERVQGTFEVNNVLGGTITGEFDAPRGAFHPTRGPGG